MAEGVATAEDAAILRREGVGFLQGYHLGRPSIERPWLDAGLARAASSGVAGADADLVAMEQAANAD